MRIHGKVVVIQRRDFKSIKLSIARSFRGIDGRVQKEVLASFKTIRSIDLDSPIVQKEFWDAYELAASRLKGSVMVNNLAEVRRKFQGIIPRPLATLPVRWETTKPVVKIDMERLQAKYPLLRPANEPKLSD